MENSELNKLTELASGVVSAPPEPIQEEKTTHPEIVKFLEDREVRPGEVRVPFFKFYYEYTKWRRRGGGRKEHDRLTHIQFGREIKSLFEQKASGSEGRVYMLNNCFKMEDLEKDKRNYERKIKWQKEQVQKKRKGKE